MVHTANFFIALTLILRILHRLRESDCRKSRSLLASSFQLLHFSTLWAGA